MLKSLDRVKSQSILLLTKILFKRDCQIKYYCYVIICYWRHTQNTFQKRLSYMLKLNQVERLFIYTHIHSTS